MTVKVNTLGAVSSVSVTVNVKFTEPFASATGVMVAVQFGAVPLNTTFATGNDNTGSRCKRFGEFNLNGDRYSTDGTECLYVNRKRS